MEISQLEGYCLAVLAGISLGLTGSGGGILTVPILVYVMGVSPVLATAYSLFVVGITAAVGSIKNGIDKNIDFWKVLVFGFPSVISVFVTRRYLLPFLPENIALIGEFKLTKDLAIMLLFASVMLVSAYMMLRDKPIETKSSENKMNYPLILALGLGIGLVAGLVGAGGGFLVVPALVLLTDTDMKTAVGTSLCIVTVQSLVGFTGDLQQDVAIDWQLLFYFTFASVIGLFIGIALGRKISGENLKSGFGWFLVAMALYIVLKELL